jgi:hypothetical protein
MDNMELRTSAAAADVDTSIYLSIYPSIESLRHSTLYSSSFYRMMMIGKDMG